MTTGDHAGKAGPLRLGFIGWGAIVQHLHALLLERDLNVEVCTVAVRDPAAVRAAGIPSSAALLSRPEELSGRRFDLLIEAAGHKAVHDWAHAAVKASKKFVIASTGALADDRFRQGLMELAEEQGTKIVIPSGAVAGMDALSAAASGLQSVVHEIVKPAKAWKGTEAEALCNLDRLAGPVTFFEATAREAAQRFPQNANVAATVALLGIGFDRTVVRLVADPGAEFNQHRLTVAGSFGNMTVNIENRPLPSNPKTSEMAALSLLRVIESEVATLV